MADFDGFRDWLSAHMARARITPRGLSMSLSEGRDAQYVARILRRQAKTLPTLDWLAGAASILGVSVTELASAAYPEPMATIREELGWRAVQLDVSDLPPADVALLTEIIAAFRRHRVQREIIPE